MVYQIFLTFDCEDFINDRSASALYHVLKLLHEYNVKGLFFSTGHMTEKISRFPRILDLLENQQIGYHSSAHSVRPIIIEYTDVEDYASARQLSLMRETAHINPITGELEGKGGIILLRNLFPNKKIVSFRAPGFSYSPPHLEALKELGIRFDFSANLSPRPINFKNLTFYPFPVLTDTIKPLPCASIFARAIFRYFTKSLLTVLVFHPQYFVNVDHWDSIYFSGNPRRLYSVQARKRKETRVLLKRFELFLRGLSYFENKNLFEITPALERGERKTSIDNRTVIKSYQKSVSWSDKYFGYKPRFIFNHYIKFFDLCE
jgi:peptidoglycan/xylan/chitin deacetylase (PgdA/CDA1 family)